MIKTYLAQQLTVFNAYSSDKASYSVKWLYFCWFVHTWCEYSNNDTNQRHNNYNKNRRSRKHSIHNYLENVCTWLDFTVYRPLFTWLMELTEKNYPDYIWEVALNFKASFVDENRLNALKIPAGDSTVFCIPLMYCEQQTHVCRLVKLINVEMM